ncbi:metallophosphoesterase [Robertmurraya sp. DFI.2.37]|uniref:metallophosphoesterase n=1 Tax=Robertmurraya sp. DFI.2.37 TaxID=3031819 RepID=UPI001243BB60|nr:metallophosphoesterase [Robertmurraya sp. DFI.2.37]MDF1506924.1 metallophosphoesterase [Robertmurraya sp. DFI.2.37]
MAKVLIVSDSHGQRIELTELKARHEKDMDLMIHCGDSELSKQDKELQGFHVVRGNCDFGNDFEKELIKELDGYRFFVAHGHLFSVKSSLIQLQYRAEEVNADIVCFGHSHLLGAEMVRNKLFINPGSLRLPRGRRERTYVILNIQGTTVDVHVYDYDSGEMTDLRQSFLFER